MGRTVADTLAPGINQPLAAPRVVLRRDGPSVSGERSPGLRPFAPSTLPGAGS